MQHIMQQHKYVVYTDYLYVGSSMEAIAIGQMIAYYAHRNGVKQEVFYLARMPDQHLRQVQNELLRELDAGNPRDDTLYVITNWDRTSQYKNLFYHEVNGLLLGSKKPFSTLP